MILMAVEGDRMAAKEEEDDERWTERYGTGEASHATSSGADMAA